MSVPIPDSNPNPNLNPIWTSKYGLTSKKKCPHFSLRSIFWCSVWSTHKRTNAQTHKCTDAPTDTRLVIPGCWVLPGSAFARHIFYLGLITFGHSPGRASVGRDHARWAQMAVRLTAPIQEFRQSHLQFTELTPNTPAQSANPNRQSPLTRKLVHHPFSIQRGGERRTLKGERSSEGGICGKALLWGGGIYESRGGKQIRTTKKSCVCV